MQPASSSAKHPRQGSDPVDGDRLVAAGLIASLEHLAEAESTMHRGRLLAASAATAALPTVVIADRQTAGRGRRGAGWWQAAGSLAMTLVVDPTWLGWPSAGERLPAAAGWSLACGVAVAESVMELVPGVSVGLRWPNDVEVGGRKLAGILAEAAPSGRVLFGIGVNTAGSVADAPQALRQRLVTIPDVGGQSLPRQPFLEVFLPRFWSLLRHLGDDPLVLRERYAPLCTLTGTPVTFYHGSEQVQGRCLGIDAGGALLLQTAEGQRSFHGGSLTPETAQWHPAEHS